VAGAESNSVMGRKQELLPQLRRGVSGCPKCDASSMFMPTLLPEDPYSESRQRTAASRFWARAYAEFTSNGYFAEGVTFR